MRAAGAMRQAGAAAEHPVLSPPRIRPDRIRPDRAWHDKLVGGGARSRRWARSMKVATDGPDLLADLRDEGRDVAPRLRTASEAHLARLDEGPAFAGLTFGMRFLLARE